MAEMKAQVEIKDLELMKIYISEANKIIDLMRQFLNDARIDKEIREEFKKKILNQ